MKNLLNALEKLRVETGIDYDEVDLETRISKIITREVKKETKLFA